MKVQAFSLRIFLAAGAFASAVAFGQNPAVKSTKALEQKTSQIATSAVKDDYVGVYITSVTRQIKLSELAKAYPAEQAGVVDKGKLAADAIVGWYDRGNNYHEQKMQNNLRPDMGGIRILPQMLRGEAIRGVSTPASK